MKITVKWRSKKGHGQRITNVSLERAQEWAQQRVGEHPIFTTDKKGVAVACGKGGRVEVNHCNLSDVFPDAKEAEEQATVDITDLPASLGRFFAKSK